jgi:hypothetical protein
MSESIPVLTTFDDPSLDTAFATLAGEVRTADTTDVEAFRLHWLGRKKSLSATTTAQSFTLNTAPRRRS